MSTHFNQENQKAKKEEFGTLSLSLCGMHCASCEVLVEQKFKKIDGVELVRVNQAAGKAEIVYSKKPPLKELQNALKGTGYTVAEAEERSAKSHTTTWRDYVETGWVLLIIAGIFFLLRLLHLAPHGLSVGANMSYGFIFAIGLVAAVSSCIAVTGGLLVAVASRYAEVHPKASGAKKFRPHVFFNVGRVVGYTLFGGLVGALGSAVTLSTRTTGVLTIVASLVMIFLGFQLLNIFPGLRKFQVKMPKFLAHRIHNNLGQSDHPAAPLALGAATFFLPCGFTQALQLYVLSRGSFTMGALTMLAFSLGTLPALVSLSALSSFLKGTAQRYFFRFAGVMVVLLGITTIGNGLALAGTNLTLGNILPNTTPAEQTASLASLVDGKQVITMKVVGYQYQPAHFTVRRGVPVEWHIDGTQAAGCAGVVLASDLEITASLPQSGEKIVSFTPSRIGSFGFTCPMGMTTRGAAIEVVADTVNSATAAAVASPSANVSPVQIQHFTMNVTRGEGFSPRSFMAKKGIPVELLVDVQTSVSGCMSTMIGSDYGIAQVLKMGQNYVRFTPTKVGTVRLTCPMGISMGQFTITN